MAPAEADPGSIDVVVVYCPAPHVVDQVSLAVPAQSTALQALHASGLLQRHGLDPAVASLGLWGRACQPEQRLRQHDRIEIYRPLLVDPKEARRQRYKGKRSAQR